MIGEVLAWVLVALFAIWAPLSAIAQIRQPWNRKLRRFDFFGLIPGWNFFAPRPIVADYFVSYRTWDAAQRAAQDWQRMPLPGERRAIDTVFNPRRRARKAQWGSADYLLSQPSRQALPIQRVTTPSYLLLLGAVTKHARATAARTGAPVPEAIQFRIDCVRGHHLSEQTLIVWLESEKHRL
ncbi:MAG: hypothetical protein JO144_16555 [Actinobacteria bacterium]|nr:hypothetical protein [Actinomycetota bacterium]